MVQYNPNPHGTSSTAGWAAYGTGKPVLSATADGLRVVVPASGTTRSIAIHIPTAPNGVRVVVAGLQIRRNTASSYMPLDIAINESGIQGAPARTSLFSNGPVGGFVVFPNTPASAVIAHYNAPSEVTGAFLEIRFSDNVASDLTIKGAGCYSSVGSDLPATAALDVGDVYWTPTLTDNSKVISVKHNAANNEAVQTLVWSWGDGTANTTNAKTNQFSAVSHTYATAGKYVVTATGTNFAGQSTASAQTLSVPSGTFTAGFTYQANYLTMDVDASSSVAPSNDPIDSYTWSWGDGSANGTGKLADHTYAQAGTYSVTLTTKTNETLRTATATKSVAITAPPNPDNYFNVVKTLLTVALTPSIQDGTAYSWVFGDGGTSTDKSPTHTYSSPGTYSVSLTVDGLSTTQQVTVADEYVPLRRLVDNLRLEVAVPPEPGTIYNRLKNPDGTKGSWGYQTPLANSTLVGSLTSNTPKDKGVSGAKLIYTSSGSGTQVFYSTPVFATAGQYAGAQFVCTYVDGYYRAVVEALNAAGAVVGTGAQTGYLGALGTSQRTTPYLLPAGTVSARVRINHYSTTAGATPALGKILQLRHLMLAYAATAALVTAAPYTESENWQDVLTSTTSISVERNALDVGTMTAVIRDAALDPAISSTIRPGQGVRLRVNAPDDAGNLTVESIYNGTLNKADVAYQDKTNITARSTRIVLSATDSTTQLAQTGESRGVALITELPEILEGAGVPYEINGSSGQVPTVQIISENENASVLDQVSITRDTSSGYAYVNKHNVLVAKDVEHMPAIAAGVVDETHFSAVDATFSTEECINAVTIVWLRYTPAAGSEPASTEEIVYGPYTDSTSIEQWGYRPATFTMQGLENATTIANKAAAILAANATPSRHINNVLLPIRNVEDLSRGKALLDLYDLVQLGYQRTATSELARVTGIKHEITPNGWRMTLGFSVNGAVAPPQQTPSPPAGASSGGGSAGTGPIVKVTGTSAGVVWSGTWIQYDAAANRLEYTKSGNVHTLGGSIRNMTAQTAIGTTVQVCSLAGNANYVPPAITINEMTVSNLQGLNIRVLIESSGLIRIQKMPNGTFNWTAGEFFPFFITWIA